MSWVPFLQGVVEGKREMDAEAAAQRKANMEADAAKKKLLFDAGVGIFKSKEGDKNVAAQLIKVSGMGEGVDWTTLANTVNNVDSSFGYNQLQFPKPFEKWEEDIRPDNKLRAGGTWLRTMNDIVRKPEERQRMREHFFQNPQDFAAFKTDVFTYGDYYIDGQRKINPVSGEIESEYIHPQDSYKSLFNFLNELDPQAENQPKASDQVTVNAHAKLIQKELNVGNISSPDKAFIFSFRTEDGKRKESVVEFADPNQLDALGRISANLGYGADKEGVQKFITNFSDVARAEDAESAYSTLLSAVEMEQFGFGDLARTMGGNQAMNQQFANYVQEEFGGDRRAAIQAYAPLIKLKEDNVPVIGFNKRRVKMKPADDYFKANGLNRSQVIDQYEANQTALRQLQQLNELLKKDNTPTGLKAAMTNFGFGIFGEGGQAAQFLGQFAIEDTTSAQELVDRAIDRGLLSKEAAQNLSVIESLKLSLAAQMARAVDPSGRLSNQDFEVQLRRLGQSGLFTSKPQVEASLGRVIDDFENNSTRLAVLYEVAQVPAKEFGKREARILKADGVIRRIESANYVATAPKPSVEPPAAEEPKTGLVLDPSGYYTDGKNNWFRDEAGTQPADMNAILNSMGMGEKS